MQQERTDRLNQVFGAVSDPTRRAILSRLSTGNSTVVNMASEFPMSLPAVSKHIRILERAGLVARKIEGRTHHLHLNAAPMQEALQWMEYYRKFWDRKLDALEDFLKEENKNDRNKK
jgi:DNA-binding transcriptional ArsR family regulator